ncbi:phospholipase-like protein [Tanacetum coccineum]
MTRNAKVRRERYEECMTFLNNPEPVYLDYYVKGFIAMQHDARFTVSKSGTASQHFRSQQFIIEMDEHIKGTLNGLTRPYPSWDDVDCVSIYADECRRESLGHDGNKFTLFPNFILDSLHREYRIPSLYHQLTEWTKRLNVILAYKGHFARTHQQPYNFQYFYNQGLPFRPPQQANLSDCCVVTCWLIYKLSLGQDLVVVGDTQRFFNNIRSEMAYQLYSCRCEDTSHCRYD